MAPLKKKLTRRKTIKRAGAPKVTDVEQEISTDQSADRHDSGIEQIAQSGGAAYTVTESFSANLAELPDTYGDSHIYLMVRDPYWLYTYWEIHKDTQDDALRQLGRSLHEVQSVLRVYNCTQPDMTGYYDIVLGGGAQTWYINAEPNHDYFIEIGIRGSNGEYIALARSNRIITPRAGMSDIIDEEWMGLDFDKMYALSGGFDVGKSSIELQQMLKKQLEQAISSGSGVGAVSSISSPVKPEKERGFWFVLDCELIVYGATEPDARVTLAGKEMPLRPDGTFSTRFALPDGFYRLDARAESADGEEIRTIIPTVQRQTEFPVPQLRSAEYA